MAPRGTLPMADEKTQKRKHKKNLMVLQSVPKKYSNRKQKKQHAKYIQGNGLTCLNYGIMLQKQIFDIYEESIFLLLSLDQLPSIKCLTFHYRVRQNIRKIALFKVFAGNPASGKNTCTASHHQFINSQIECTPVILSIHIQMGCTLSIYQDEIS